MNQPLRLTHPHILQRLARVIQHELDIAGGGLNAHGFVLLIVPVETGGAGDVVSSCRSEDLQRILDEARATLTTGEHTNVPTA